MPRREVARGTNFIIEDEGWKMIEADFTSVEGIIYMSLTESKVNYIYDDLVEDIADTDKLAAYRLEAPDILQEFVIGAEIKPTYTLMKNGEPYEAEIEWDSSDKSIARVINGKLIAVAYGDCVITATLKNFPQIHTEMNVRVSGSHTPFSAYIEGKDKLRLDRQGIYILVGTQPINGEVTYTLNDDTLAEILSVEDNKCIIHANNKNKLGDFTVIATYDGQEFSKTITVVPLW
jgi:hypothetical protein